MDNKSGITSDSINIRSIFKSLLTTDGKGRFDKADLLRHLILAVATNPEIFVVFSPAAVTVDPQIEKLIQEVVL